MRKLLISMLLAGAAASPALAQDHGRFHDREAVGSNHQERQQAREQARAERTEQAQPREERAPRFEMRQQQADGGQRGFDRPRFEGRQQRADDGQRSGGFDRSRFERADRGNVQAAPPQETVNPGPRVVSNGFVGRDERADRSDRAERSGGPRVVRVDGDNGRGWVRGSNGWSREGDLRQSTRPVPNVMRTRNPLVVSDRPREGTQPALRTDGRRWAGTSNWNHNWRNDHRYNWRDYRDRHRSRFHLGIYYDPFGWAYRPYQIGWRLWPGYYGSRYWINDPAFYSLPYAPPGTRWIRYWDDALLVDTFTGEVIDVIHNFFW